jgi:Cu+-exporting ATPase
MSLMQRKSRGQRHSENNKTMTPSEVQPAPDACVIDWGITGMTCASCSGRVERALAGQPGVAQVSVNLATERVHMVLAPGDMAEDTPARLRRAIRDAGYGVRVEASSPEESDAQHWRELWPVLAAAALSLPLVWPMVAGLWGAHAMLPVAWQFALATPVQFVLGARFYRAAWYAIKAGSGNMDLLVALGTTAGWALSVGLWWAAPAGHEPHVYFESAAVVITLVLLGKWMEARVKRSTTQAIRALQALRPLHAHWLGPDGEQDIDLADVLVGDHLSVLPGERIPADGVVLEGHSQADESLLTGEPLPVSKGPQDRVTGGSINGNGRLVMRVAASGADSVLAHIIRMVEEAQAHKAPIQRLVDQVAAVFVPTVLAVAVVTGLAWWWWGAAADVALIHAVAVLVIACPCALGLATPMAIVAGTGMAAQRGILIRDPQTLETAQHIDMVVFDKTGTLTQGKPTLQALVVLPTSAETGDAGAENQNRNDNHSQAQTQAPAQAETQALSIAASLQAASEHPLARAVLQAAAVQKLVFGQASQVAAVPGMGLAGEVNGQRWCLGSVRWAASQGVDVTPWQPQVAVHQQQGHSVSLLWPEGAAPVPVALLAFGDAIKAGARADLDALRARGLQLRMLSGDSPVTAQAVAAQLGFAPQEVQAGMLPGDKAQAVRDWHAQGHVVAFVGDGINDAPALVAADLGMAMAQADTGTDVAMHAAGLTLMRGELRLVGQALDVCRLTVQKIRQNLFWAFVFNAAGIPLAASGWLTPVLAGMAMSMSSLSVMLNALLLRRHRAPH